jgi:hypothetical protein
MEVVVTGHNFESILPKDLPCHVCFKLADSFQKRRLLNNFPIGSYVTVTEDQYTFNLHSIPSLVRPPLEGFYNEKVARYEEWPLIRGAI